MNTETLQIAQLIGVACLSPAIVNSLSALGGLGNSSPYIANFSAFWQSISFVICSIFGGYLLNKLGPAPLEFVGALTFALSVAAQRQCAFNESWKAVVGITGVLQGCGAVCFWTAHTFITTHYPTTSQRSRNAGVFWMAYNGSGVLYCIVWCILNLNNQFDISVDYTYTVAYIFMGAACITPILFGADPKNVEREDMTRVIVEQSNPPSLDCGKVSKVICNKYMALLTILFWTSLFTNTFQYNGINGLMFTMRSRCIAAAVTLSSQIIGSYVFATTILDNENLKLRDRAIYCLLAIWLTLNIACGCSYWMYNNMNGGIKFPIFKTFGKPFGDQLPGVDISEWRCLIPLFITSLFSIGSAVTQSFAFWLIMQLAGGAAPTTCASFASYYNTIQQIGIAAAAIIDYMDVKYITQLYINWGLIFVLIIPVYFVCQSLQESAKMPFLFSPRDYADSDSKSYYSHTLSAPDQMCSYLSSFVASNDLNCCCK